jgi:hypothetical protein
VHFYDVRGNIKTGIPLELETVVGLHFYKIFPLSKPYAPKEALWTHVPESFGGVWHLLGTIIAY